MKASRPTGAQQMHHCRPARGAGTGVPSPYLCYLRQGSIAARLDERLSDSFDEKPNSFSFLLRAPGEQPIVTVRITVVRPDLGWTDSPASHVFADDPAFQRLSQHSFVEASRLFFLQPARRDMFVRLLGNMAALADFYGVSALVACPRVEHT